MPGIDVRNDTVVRRFLIVFLMFVTSGNVLAGTADSLPPSRVQAIDEFVQQFVDLAMFDGSILIDIGGVMVYEKSFGYANIEFGVRHNAGSRFRIASVSKTLTDAAAATMIDRGTLSIDTPIAEYLPDFPYGQEITIRHLLNHTSGIPHTNRQPWGDGSISLSTNEIVERLAELPLDFEPGTNSSYSNGGYAVLVKVMEIAGKGSYSEVMHDTVFDVLSMRDTDHISDSRATIPRLATGYAPGTRPGARRHSSFYAVETRPGGGSLYSTAGDLHRFMRGVFRDGFVSDGARREVMGYDDGEFLSQGRSPGFVAKIYYESSRDIIVISVANSYAVPTDWAASLANLASGETMASPWPAVELASLKVSSRDPRIGRYRSSWGYGLAIERSAEGFLMFVDVEEGSRTALIPLADGSFLQPQYFQRCRQKDGTRVITCRILPDDERYMSTLTPIAD